VYAAFKTAVRWHNELVPGVAGVDHAGLTDRIRTRKHVFVMRFVDQCNICCLYFRRKHEDVRDLINAVHSVFSQSHRNIMFKRYCRSPDDEKLQHLGAVFGTDMIVRGTTNEKVDVCVIVDPIGDRNTYSQAMGRGLGGGTRAKKECASWCLREASYSLSWRLGCSQALTFRK